MKKEKKIKTITLVGRSKLALLRGGNKSIDMKEDLTACACCICNPGQSGGTPYDAQKPGGKVHHDNSINCLLTPYEAR
ncbi:MAG: hypothetical protein LBH91_00795 [Prevotellaceae bacterium]|jgi:hypothetical protein|nr:hypothetical protein [Prevotellaceae bacterium]